MNDGTIQDCRTGLVWLKDINGTDGITKSSGYLNWYDAMVWVAALGDGHCGLTDGSSAGDWRLPNKSDWMAMVASAKKRLFTSAALTDESGTAHWTEGHPFNNVRLSNFYWMSTTYTADMTRAWIVHMQDGNFFTTDKNSVAYVRPVRGRQSGTFGNLIIQ